VTGGRGLIWGFGPPTENYVFGP